MNVQEALIKVKQLKAEVGTLKAEAEASMISTQYTEVDEKHYNGVEIKDVDQLLKLILAKIADIHAYKLAIQKANTTSGAALLLQEMDMWKTVLSDLDEFIGVKQIGEPQPESVSFHSSVFKVDKANFTTDEVDKLARRLQMRIRAIDAEIQELNWKTEILGIEDSPIINCAVEQGINI